MEKVWKTTKLGTNWSYRKQKKKNFIQKLKFYELQKEKM